MKSRALRVLQALMLLVAAAHIVIGTGLNLASDGTIEALATQYGADVAAWNPQFLYIVKPLGAFMFALGLLAAVCVGNPRKYRAIVYAFVVLFVARAGQRFAFGQEVADTFGIDSTRNILHAVFFVLLAGALVVCDRLGARAPSSQAA